VLFILITLLLPVLLVAAAVTDLVLWIRRRKPWMAVRLLGMAWWFLFGEMRILPAILVIWLATGGPRGDGSLRRRRWVYDLRIHWMRSNLGGLRALFGMKLEVDGLDQAGPGPVLILMRHASIIDNTLPDALAGHAHGMGLRFVIKRELQALPSIDIAGRWVPTSFVRRASKDPAAELAVLRQLATEFGPPSTEGILIYPEGTRCTEEKLARAKAIIAERQPEIAPLANRLRHVLPPRLGGPLALLEATAGTDVVFCAHVGLDGFERVSDIWGGGLVGKPVRVKFWRCPASEVPAGDAERTAWLYGEWQRVDDWIGEQIAPASGPPGRAAREPAVA
jgi:1-acyl-sn-glycerol-3-phosphate acyltransferase